MRTGRFITLEGVEGAGKSTALNFIQACLVEENIDTMVTREPGGTPLAEAIRKLLLHSDEMEKMTPETELLMMFAARKQHLNYHILPALQSGKWVISDRYIDASYAYQGGGRKIDDSYINMLDKWLVDGYYPDLTILLNIDPNQGLKRISIRKTEKDRIEQEQIEFFERVQAVYLARADQDPKRIKIVDSSQSLLEVESQIRDIVRHFISSTL